MNRWNVTLVFETPTGVKVERKVTIRDQYRSSAIARAERNAVAPGAIIKSATAVRA